MQVSFNNSIDIEWAITAAPTLFLSPSPSVPPPLPPYTHPLENSCSSSLADGTGNGSALQAAAERVKR